ncbi:hypothetical protein MRBLWH7_002593 [Microbacterium sp. LWH7-1.2]|uniref:hypothetical protein n=1 Tax=Microbacterium sp. LWH7-1.2 TaxID=3135257 RepID=UPI0031396E4E
MVDVDVQTQDRWRRLDRITGIAGVAATVLLFTPIIAISTLGEPGFDGSRAEAAEFFSAGDTSWVTTAEATAAVGMLAFLWFVACLTTRLRGSEGEPAWRSTVALGSGVLVAAYGVIDASWEAAFNRGSELEPAIAVFAFDLGNLGFANAWVALGSFAIAAGWAILAGRALAAWWAWWAIVAGAGLLVVRFFWEGWAWTAPYFLFWVWVIALAIRLLARRVPAPAPNDLRAQQ